MQILNKSIRIVDYENNRISAKDTPESFDDYVFELISHITTNDSVRDYKADSPNKEVVSCIRELIPNLDNLDFINLKQDLIAQRLLQEEIKAQEKIHHLRTKVQKGSLIQAVLLNDETNTHVYLLAKVEHTGWFDDADYILKTGFSQDKKNIWKSCLFDMSNLNAEMFTAKIYSNNKAEFWSCGFLELEEMISDETNTQKAFAYIDSTLNYHFKGKSKNGDHTAIRNAFITHFRNNEHIDYNNMVEDILGNYQPMDTDEDKIKTIQNKLLNPPATKNFDRQFNAKPAIINAKIRSTYKVNEGIELRISQEINNLPETISSFESNDGKQYLKIRVTNPETYKRFNFS